MDVLTGVIALATALVILAKTLLPPRPPLSEPKLPKYIVTELLPGTQLRALLEVTPDMCEDADSGLRLRGGDMIQLLAQLGPIALLSDPRHFGERVVCGGVKSFRFHRTVRDGDTLELIWTLQWIRGPIGCAKVEAAVDGQTVARGFVTFALRPDVDSGGAAHLPA